MSAPSPAIADPTRSSYRWVMLGVLWLAYASFGMITTSLAPLITPISEELDLSRSAMGIILGAWALVYIFAAVPVGTLLDRIGTRKGYAIGLLIIAASGFGRALAIGPISMFLAVAIFGLGGPVLSVGSPKLIAQWFGAKERGTAIGIYMTGPFIGSAFALSSANSLFMPLFNDSWRLTIAAFATTVLVAGGIWIATAKEPKAIASGTRRAKGRHGWREFAVLLRVPLVQTILVMALLAFLFNHAMNNWLPEILRSGGMDAVTAGYWASLPTLVSIFSSLTLPRLATPARRVTMLALMYGCLCCAALLLASGIVLLEVFFSANSKVDFINS